MNVETKDAKDKVFYSDVPVAEPGEDLFRRWPFSQRVAQTIAIRRDPSSLVVGIYGPWGDGKTSVLNFIEHELANHNDVLVIRFNPWRFNNEVQLLTGFFSLLAEQLDRSIKTKTEKLGDLLHKYGKLVAPISVTIPGAGAAAGSAVQGVGSALAEVDVSELKERIEKILAEEKRRVVIVMDDIDRLDKQEIYSIFRLVKLTGDFHYTTYILAFDEHVVSASLAERYGSGDISSGRAFLEKIVQVPLNLPKADHISLRDVCFQGVDFAVRSSGLTLTDDQAQAFVHSFTKGLEFRLTTPRLGKRYANALCFSFPILRGEVDPVDLALIEGVRIFLPKLYEIIRDNRELFLGEGYDRRGLEKKKEEMLEIIDAGLVGLSKDERNSIKGLIKDLFPRTSALFGNTHYGSEWDKEWSRHKKIASTQYFDRYFSYAIPSGDVSDQKVRDLIESAATLDEAALTKSLSELMGTRGADRLITKIWQHIEDIPENSAVALAKVIGKFGDKIPNPEHLFSSIAGPWARVGQLIGDLLERAGSPKARTDVAITIMKDAEPIELACQIFRWLWQDEDKKTFSFFGKQGIKQIGTTIADRIKNYANGSPTYISSPTHSPTLLGTWRRWSSRTEVTKYLMGHLNKKPEDVSKFLSGYQPIAWGMESGKRSRSEFERTSYDNLSWTVDPAKIYSLLIKVYGKELKDPKFHLENCKQPERQLAHQFAFIHLKVLAESTAKENANQSK